MKTTICIIFTFLCIVTTSFSQTSSNHKNAITIEQQFDSLIKHSSKYEEFRVVKTNNIYELKSNVLDSLTVSRKNILETKSVLNTQNSTIDSLKSNITILEENISDLKTKTESISFLGIHINNDTFKSVVLSIIALLIILLLIFITKFNQRNTITNKAKQDLKELEEEFDLHRKNALEREQKARRLLQDEINKNKKDN
jgi:cell division protein FtsB